MSRILLLLDQKENQQLLADELEQGNEVVAASEDAALGEAYDLLVIDGRALDRTWERVQERRRSERPLYLPVLLVTSRPNVKMVTRHLWRSIDELILTPIEKPELRARIQILLRVRKQSLELRERAETAEQAVNMRDQLMEMVSHDLRNPLNVVLSHTSLLLETATGLESRQRDQLQAIHRAVHQMSRLAEDLIDVAGLESGYMKVRPSLEPVAPLLLGAVQQHRHTAEAHDVALTCEIEDGLPPVNVDRARMDQLLGNLVTNALKFTPAGGAVVVRAGPAGERVRFAVRDTGPGLSEDDAAHVFERFWKGRATDEGSGLGLAIAQGIVLGHGGRIGVKTAPGEGAEFWFELPAATEPA